MMIESLLDTTNVVTESEREAAEVAIAERLGDSFVRIVGRSCNSPYSPETVIFLAAASASEHGTRIAIAPVCKSHNGAENTSYKGHGRWRTVCVAAAHQDGALAVCKASDRDAEQVGAADFYVRPWETHDAEQATRGLGLAADAMSAAFAALGL